MFILYTVAPLIYRTASSAYYNISLLTSDFYGLLFGLFLFVCCFASSRKLLSDYITALLTLLAILPCILRCDSRSCYLLLECHT
jgi:hypothetical protein